MEFKSLVRSFVEISSLICFIVMYCSSNRRYAMEAESCAAPGVMFDY